MTGLRLIRILAPVVVLLLLGAAACGGQDPSPPEPAPEPAPAAAPEPAPAATVESTEPAAPDPVPAPDPEPVPEPAAPEVTEETATSPAPDPNQPAPADPDAAEIPGAAGGAAAELEGRWEGGIAIPGPSDLPFAVELTASGDGLRGTIDIQGFSGLPLSNVVLDAGRIHFELESPLGLAVWDGEVGDGVIEGEFTQAGMAETFWLQRFEDPSEGEGPSFRREEVVFANGDVALAGELTFPEGDGPHPAVVLISGSGDQDRDSDVSGFRLFAVLANHLAGAGVASLRFDDRGVGGSAGDGLQATLEDRAGDVEAAVEVLRSRADIAAGKVGLVGHSEGGIVAPVVADRIDGIAFVVLLAAPVLPLADTLVEQQIVLLEESGATAAEAEQFLALQESVFRAVATGQGWDEVEATLRAQVQQEFEALSDEVREAIPNEEAMVDSTVADTVASWQSPWFESFLEHDPRPPIVALEVPVLALFGELDTQVPAAGNSTAMSEAIAESSVPGYTIATILSANHLFQEAVTGSVNEYARLKRQFAPDFVQILTDWLSEFTGPAVEPLSEPLSEAQIRRLVAEFVDDDRQSVGVVAGVTGPGGRVVVGHGRLSADDPTPPDGNTVFEIGSVTKVFTSTVLADLVSREELGLDTTVQSLLGDDVWMPARSGAEITLGHLATHSSGLPRLPDNLDPEDPTNPYADYTVEDLYDFLSSHELRRGIGETVEYSNVGFGLLGHALALREGTDFETLIAERILEPLQMTDTAVELTPALRERMATGHDGRLEPAANWDLPVLAGAGALRSTVNDLLTFVEANLGLRGSPLGEAMAFARMPRQRDPALDMDIGLGWIIADEADRRFVWHNGATGGYASFIGFDVEAGEGIVVLSNSAVLVDYLAYRLFTRDFDG